MTVVRIKTSTGWLDLSGQPGPPGPPGSISTPSDTVDTFESYKIILFADGRVRAIPASALPPDEPDNFDLTTRLSSVRAEWDAVSGATSYVLYRTGLDPVEGIITTSYRDIDITVGSTYNYWIQAVDQYGQRSQVVGPESAFINPALNTAPTVLVRAWPTTFPSDGQTLIRVNQRDVDAQELAIDLDVDAGTLTPTDDPTVFLYNP